MDEWVMKIHKYRIRKSMYPQISNSLWPGGLAKMDHFYHHTDVTKVLAISRRFGCRLWTFIGAHGLLSLVSRFGLISTKFCSLSNEGNFKVLVLLLIESWPYSSHNLWKSYFFFSSKWPPPPPKKKCKNAQFGQWILKDDDVYLKKTQHLKFEGKGIFSWWKM